MAAPPVSTSKDLVAAAATPLVLGILACGESYGYAILKEVRERSGGALEWSEGMLYPMLHRLERRGLIRARWRTSDEGRRRKYYRIVKAGRAALADERAAWTAVDSVLRGIWGQAHA
jgi:DNA-binding PadR family transcriptional regulator